MDTLKELLGTDNKKEQVKKVQELLKAVSSPAVDLIIRYENEQVTLSILGGDVSFDVLYRMLDLTGQILRKQEIEMALQQQANIAASAEKEVEE